MRQDLKAALAGMRYHALALMGVGGGCAHLNGLGEVDKALELAMGPSKAEDVAAAMRLMERARGGSDPEAVTELNALRTQTVDLYVKATSNFMRFFEEVTLQPADQVCWVNTYSNPVRVRYIGQDGSPTTTKAVKAQKQAFVDMRELQTDEVGYQVRDINQGTDIAVASQKTVNLAWDMANKVDTEAFTLLTAGKSLEGEGNLRGLQDDRCAAGADVDCASAHPDGEPADHEQPGAGRQWWWRGPEQQVPDGSVPGGCEVLRELGKYLGRAAAADGDHLCAVERQHGPERRNHALGPDYAVVAGGGAVAELHVVHVLGHQVGAGAGRDAAAWSVLPGAESACGPGLPEAGDG